MAWWQAQTWITLGLGLVIAIFGVVILVAVPWDGPAGVPSLPGLGLMGLVLLLARWAMAGEVLTGLGIGLYTLWGG